MNALLGVEAAAALADRALRKLRDDVLALEEGVRRGVLPEQPAAQPRGELVVRLAGVRAPGDVDLAVIDPAGRRISGLWSRGATSIDLPGADGETLALAALWNGRYQILVSRAAAGAFDQPVSGEVVVRVRDQRQAIPFSFTGSDAVVAEVRYQKLPRPIGCY
jgi:hypothetical protein